jgi:protease I
MNTSVVVIIASNGYQPIEYMTTKKILEQAGFMVTVASNAAGTAVASDTTTTHVDVALDNIAIEQYAAIILIGGPGAMEHLDNKEVYTLLKNAYHLKKIIAAICIAPRILANAGLLKGKRMTGWDGDGELANIARTSGAIYDPRYVVIDGSIITASGPQAAYEFGIKIVERLSI